MKNFKIIQLPVIVMFMLLMASCGGNNREESLKYVDKGVEFYYKAQFNKAFEFFNKAIDEDKGNFEAYFWLGNFYNNKRNYKKAIEFYNKAIELDPGFADAYANRGNAKRELGDKKGACNDWKKAEQLGKPNLENSLRWCE